MIELHHTVKRGANGKPNTLADLYGSVWLSAGQALQSCIGVLPVTRSWNGATSSTLPRKSASSGHPPPRGRPISQLGTD
jgi:hypothetical protein